ncbi:hypothetical protein DNU06_06705 [Putridiphycobacter roseus]|uniref:TonB C-terminal domain-containing protein n=1 Tax=Putridiphycobacter roseus TaxID=2219161 RepID=A0A2W1NEI5_9FLAO|nr:energy transducer TonB [Putridiphycobacter roseus]PZE17513.1 hypothetical protein DNU06_06705 [Putridiphycobacter roseus]
MKKLVLLIAIAFVLPITASAGNVKPVKSKLFTWVSENLTYPTAAITNKETGVVFVSFQIDKNGKAENIQIQKGISNTLNQAAMEVVKNMPLQDIHKSETPEKEYVLPVRFTIQ